MLGNNRNARNGLIFHIVLMIAIVTILFGSYFIGQRSFVFLDVATDSAGQTYPGLVRLARDISDGNIGSHWNYTDTLGNSQGIILPKISNLECYFGVENVRYLMGVGIALKVFLSGIFFYLYLKKMNISDITSSIFSIFYACSAHMIIRASWKGYPNEVLLLAIWLWAFEVWNANKKKWIGISLVTVFFYFNMGSYYVVLYTAVFLIYGIYRIFLDENNGDYKYKCENICWFIGAIICGIVSTIAIWGNGVHKSIQSDRFSKGINEEVGDIFTDILTIKTAFFRTIGMDILGINDYCGSTNFLEAPAFYCGILTLVVLPTIIISINKKKKVFYCAGLVGILMYICIRPVRVMINGFSGDSFKQAQLVVIVFLIYITAKEFDVCVLDRNCLKISYINITAIIITMLSFVFYIKGTHIIKLVISLGFIWIYVILINLRKIERLSIKQFMVCVLFVAVIEVIIMAYGSINNRVTMDGEDVYNDGTIEALDYINQRNNKDNFYRIDKLYHSMLTCDSLYQDYMGTGGYTGGIGGRKSTQEFYNLMSMPTILGERMQMGFSSSTSINTLMNVRYVLSKSGMCSNFGYTNIGKVGDITVYENNYYLPLGYVYDKYITLDKLKELSTEERRRVIMSACVIEDIKNVNIEELEEIEKIIDLSGYEIDTEITINSDSHLIIKLPVKNDNYVNIVGLDVESESYKSSMHDYYDENYNIVSNFIGISEGRNTYYLEFNDSKTIETRIFDTNQYNINDIKVYQVPKDIYYGYYIEKCDDLKANAMNVEIMDSNCIKGFIDSNKDGIITFSIPYDTNWHIYIDGIERELSPVNIGMMGTEITKGNHNIELKYDNGNDLYVWSSMMMGCLVITVIGILNVKRRY